MNEVELIVRCHIVAAAMHFFSMGSTDDEPHTSAFPANVAALPLEECMVEAVLSIPVPDCRQLCPSQAVHA